MSPYGKKKMITFSSFRSHCSPSSGDGATGRRCLRAAKQNDHISSAAAAAGALSERAAGDEVSGHGEKKSSRSCACTPRLDRIIKASASANVSDLTVNGGPPTPSCQNAYRGRVAPGTGLGEKKITSPSTTARGWRVRPEGSLLPRCRQQTVRRDDRNSRDSPYQEKDYPICVWGKPQRYRRMTVACE